VIYNKTAISDLSLLEIEPIEDNRGFFARSWCKEEFRSKGLNCEPMQCGISFNKITGTVRGMHYQSAPFEEVKLVRCTKGAIYDVVLDLRKDSPTYKQHVGFELSELNHKMLYIPAGLAHGFQTLKDNTEVNYQISQVYSGKHSHGVRWNDPSFSITWPLPVTSISDKDQDYEDYIA